METLPYMCRHITLAASVPLALALALALAVDLGASFVVIYYGQWRVKQLPVQQLLRIAAAAAEAAPRRKSLQTMPH